MFSIPAHGLTFVGSQVLIAGAARPTHWAHFANALVPCFFLIPVLLVFSCRPRTPTRCSPDFYSSSSVFFLYLSNFLLLPQLLKFSLFLPFIIIFFLFIFYLPFLFSFYYAFPTLLKLLCKVRPHPFLPNHSFLIIIVSSLFSFV